MRTNRVVGWVDRQYRHKSKTRSSHLGVGAKVHRILCNRSKTGRRPLAWFRILRGCMQDR